MEQFIHNALGLAAGICCGRYVGSLASKQKGWRGPAMLLGFIALAFVWWVTA